MPTTAPYGSWKSPISAALVASAGVRLGPTPRARRRPRLLRLSAPGPLGPSAHLDRVGPPAHALGRHRVQAGRLRPRQRTPRRRRQPGRRRSGGVGRPARLEPRRRPALHQRRQRLVEPLPCSRPEPANSVSPTRRRWPATPTSSSPELLSCPVILLQGLEDAVVPPAQAEQMAGALGHRLRLPRLRPR